MLTLLRASLPRNGLGKRLDDWIELPSGFSSLLQGSAIFHVSASRSVSLL